MENANTCGLARRVPVPSSDMSSRCESMRSGLCAWVFPASKSERCGTRVAAVLGLFHVKHAESRERMREREVRGLARRVCPYLREGPRGDGRFPVARAGANREAA